MVNANISNTIVYKIKVEVLLHYTPTHTPQC